jgi:hypothetical protein
VVSWPEAVLFGTVNGGTLNGDGEPDGTVGALIVLLPEPGGVGTLPVPALEPPSDVVFGSG